MYKGKYQLQKRKEAENRKAQIGKELLQEKVIRVPLFNKLNQIYSVFQGNLQTFARKYREQITTDQKFRSQFYALCQDLGVDPMLSKKTIWTQLGFGDFYHHLSMKILEICNKHRHINGGIMKIAQVIKEYKKHYKQQISVDDVKKSMNMTKILGNLEIFNHYYVCIVPRNFSIYLADLMNIAQKVEQFYQFGFINVEILVKQKGWSEQQFNMQISSIKKEGLLWVDKKSSPFNYYFSSMMLEFGQKNASVMCH